MTQDNPMQQAYTHILHSYNPLEIKDILIHGAWRKATKHKDWDAVLSYYQEWQPYIHHYLLDSPEVWDNYALMQKAYTMSTHTAADQKEYIKDVFYLYMDVIAADIGHKWNLHSTPRKQIEDDVLAIELKIKKEQFKLIDGGKS